MQIMKQMPPEFRVARQIAEKEIMVTKNVLLPIIIDTTYYNKFNEIDKSGPLDRGHNQIGHR